MSSTYINIHRQILIKFIWYRFLCLETRTTTHPFFVNFRYMYDVKMLEEEEQQRLRL
jgi:hypothetical protein